MINRVCRGCADGRPALITLELPNHEMTGKPLCSHCYRKALSEMADGMEVDRSE
jgi:hypothetical protein